MVIFRSHRVVAISPHPRVPPVGFVTRMTDDRNLIPCVTAIPEEFTMAEDIPFEAALAELQQLVTSLETGQVTLQDALARYERGVGLVAHCQSLLETAHQRIEIVVRRTAEGTVVTAPFDLPATIDSDSPATPALSPRRKPKSSKEPPKERGLFESPVASPAPAALPSRGEIEEAPFD